MADIISAAALAELSSFLADAPEELSIEDMKHHPNLARLVILADDIGSRVGRRTLEWMKTSGTGCDPVPGEPRR